MRSILVGLLIVGSILLGSTIGRAAEQPDATVKMTGKSLAAGVGFSWGSGVSTCNGKQYPFSINELSVGDIGISSAELSGQVFNLMSLEDFNGNYTSFGALVRLALPSQNPTVALFRQRQAQMYAGYNKSVTPLERFISLGQFAVSRTVNGAFVFNLPLDYLVWTEPMAQLLTGANQLVNELPGIKEKQVWLTGTLSPRARKEIESRGWQVRDQAEAQLFSWVETYPDYKKPEERMPAGLVTLSLKSAALGVGASRGEGTLNFQGNNYPFTISGMSLVDVGISNFTGAGKVYDLRSPGDLTGTYGATQSTFAIAGGDFCSRSIVCYRSRKSCEVEDGR